MSMTLGVLIGALEKLDPDVVVRYGFDNPHSYRGFYDELAFEPAENVSVGDMRHTANSAVGATFTGWKGGDYTMSRSTPCHIAYEGDCGEELGAEFLGQLLIETVEASGVITKETP